MKNNKLAVLVFSLILLIFSACTKENDIVEDDSWENEVLLASECGMDGLQCCVAPEEECKYGQECCHDPYNPNHNYCADDCTLGKELAFCRLEEPKCDEGLACSDSRCIKCGSEDEPCCYGETECEGALICYEETCEQCGLPGNVCCDDNAEYACENENLLEKGRTQCLNGTCSYCGYGGAIACIEEPFCNANHLFNGKTCFQCGELNQPCCQINGLNSSQCIGEQGLKCELGFCTIN